ncbi:MAG TPA: Do family serine endopeptidase [Caulobacteraceae bacterium]|nr:Do family serine endopeptidase [Caulobacteraceae bacterium]
MKRKQIYAATVVSAAALALAGVGGYWTRASAESNGAVNGPQVAAPGGPGQPFSFSGIVKRVSPAVVSIDCDTRAGPEAASYSGGGQDGQPFTFQFGGGGNGDQDGFPFGDLQKMFPQMQQGQGDQAARMRVSGSGFFISRDGYVVTNNHVIDGAVKITVVTADNRRLHARLVGRDPATDLAVLKVDGTDFPYVSFEERAQPQVGDWVVAMGNPFGLGGTVTAGIVSALERRHVSDSSYVDYMQIDAPINRGNSGGPTFDLQGRVVGVNTSIYSPSGGSVGIGFDIPADVAAKVTSQLIHDGKVVRGYIGATVQEVTPDIADSLGLSQPAGALVAELTPGGPSDRAGLKTGDLILKLDGREVKSSEDLTRQVGLVRAGDVIRLTVVRDGRQQEIDVRSGVRPDEQQLAANDRGANGAQAPGDNQSASVLGMRLEPDPQGGVAIDGVKSDSDAAEKGLSRGDVIVMAGGLRTATPQDLASAVAKTKQAGRKDVLLRVKHGGQTVFVPLSVTNG